MWVKLQKLDDLLLKPSRQVVVFEACDSVWATEAARQLVIHGGFRLRSKIPFENSVPARDTHMERGNGRRQFSTTCKAARLLS